MQRDVSSYAIAPSVKVKLLNAGFLSAADLCDLRPLQLSKEACISQEEAVEVLQAVRCEPGQERAAAAGRLTALELLGREQELGAIVTFCSALDMALGGGMPVGKTTEVCGAPGVGKTQLCIQLSVDVQIPVCFGGLGGKCLYIDTEGSFLVQRAVDLAQAAVEHCGLLAEDSEQQEALKGFTVETILSNLFLVRCHDYVELLAETYLLADFLAQHPGVRLVVIDSIAFPFRHDFDDLSQRTRLLNGLAQRLIQMATNHNVAVVLTNQMTTKVWNGQSKLVPALGESWGHAATQRLILHWEGTHRLASLYKSPSQREATVPYQITGQGFRDAPPSDQPKASDDPSVRESGSLSKRPRMEDDQSTRNNCPFSLAAALARATVDSVLQSDLSTYHVQKTVEDGVDPFPQIESVAFARLIFNKLCETCCLWLKDFPYRRRPQPYYETSIHAIKNMRRKMEDKHIVIPDFNTLFNIQDQEEQAFFAVFDGHGGVDAAIYAANHLHVNMVHQECFSQDPGEALCRAFRVTDERFIRKAKMENLRCGTTGVVTFLRGRTLYVAWLGDSQVMLVKKGQAVELMKPHKPDREDEKQRIEALGGCVIWFGTWRVNGSLSVSRAIGDNEHKPYISGDADHHIVTLDGTEDYLILACDGFYDTVSPDEAVRVVSDHLTENSGDSTMVAHKLVASARDAGSSDNISVIVVFLRDLRAPPPGEEEGAGEEVEDEEVEEEGQGEMACQDGGTADVGGKGHCFLQQCSAPADLGYEDRMDSLTDRTSLGLLGPTLGEEGPIRLPLASSHPSPSLGLTQNLMPADGHGAAWLPCLEEGLKGSRHKPRPKLRVPTCQEPSSDGQWPLAAALFGYAGRHTRRMECVSPRWGWGSRDWGRAPRELPGLLHSTRSVPYPLRCPERRPGVALPHLPNGSRV